MSLSCSEYQAKCTEALKGCRSWSYECKTAPISGNVCGYCFCGKTPAFPYLDCANVIFNPAPTSFPSFPSSTVAATSPTAGASSNSADTKQEPKPAPGGLNPGVIIAAVLGSIFVLVFAIVAFRTFSKKRETRRVIAETPTLSNPRPKHGTLQHHSLQQYQSYPSLQPMSTIAQPYPSLQSMSNAASHSMVSSVAAPVPAAYSAYNVRDSMGDSQVSSSFIYSAYYPAPSMFVPGGHYKVARLHAPSETDEIEIRPGETVSIERVFHDGWCIGSNLDTGSNGVFPTQCLHSFQLNISSASSHENS